MAACAVTTYDISLCTIQLWDFRILPHCQGVRDFSVWAVSVTGLFGLGRSGLETFRPEYEILQKSYMFTF